MANTVAAGMRPLPFVLVHDRTTERTRLLHTRSLSPS
jgi:hypothetical protein